MFLKVHWYSIHDMYYVCSIYYVPMYKLDVFTLLGILLMYIEVRCIYEKQRHTIYQNNVHSFL